MSEPKFSIGDRVAVCSLPEYRTVIPATAVIAQNLLVAGSLVPVNSIEVRRLRVDLWEYQVEGSGIWFAEEYLRPISPDEYTDLASQENTEKV